MIATKKLLVLVLWISAIPVESQTNAPNNSLIDSSSSEAAFRSLLLNTIFVELYFAPYTFLWGNTLSGSALSHGEDPKNATAKWAATSVGGMILGWLAADGISKEYQNVLRSVPWSSKSTVKRFYTVMNIGVSTSSILDFQAESTSKLGGGWTASTPEVNTTTTFPTLGHRIGTSSRWWGGEFETALISHHTTKQIVSYDANGVIYIQDTPLPVNIGQVEIPDRFLMLHSLSMGANFYIWLPKVGVSPYVGLGARILLNSTQSQYPGPANLTQSEGKLALDSKNLGWGVHALFGFRAPLSEMKFAFAEFRPTRHYFGYKSGESYFKERDRFTLQIFEFQFGLGFYY